MGILVRKNLRAPVRVPMGTNVNGQIAFNGSGANGDKPLGGGLVVMPESAPAYNGVSNVGNSRGKLNYFRSTCDNSAGLVDALYFIGSDFARLVIDPALLRPDTGSIDPVVMAQAFQFAAVGVGLINIATSSDPQQFQQRFEYYHDVDINGQKPFEPIAMPLAPRNNQFQDLRLTIQPSSGNFWAMDWDSGFLVNVLAGEILTLAFEPAELGGR